MRLVEPQVLTGQRMLRGALTHLLGAQMIARDPSIDQFMRVAIFLDNGFFVCLEDNLPRKIEISVIVADIQNAAPTELVHNVCADLAGDVREIGDRRLATGLGWFDAMKAQPHRPVALVGIFVVQDDLRRRRIFGRRVNAFACRRARCRTVDVRQRSAIQGTERSGEHRLRAGGK